MCRMDAILHGHGTVELHEPNACIPWWEGGCQLVHLPESKLPAHGFVLACGEGASMHPWARLISSTLFPAIRYIFVAASRLRIIPT